MSDTVKKIKLQEIENTIESIDGVKKVKAFEIYGKTINVTSGPSADHFVVNLKFHATTDNVPEIIKAIKSNMILTCVNLEGFTVIDPND